MGRASRSSRPGLVLVSGVQHDEGDADGDGGRGQQGMTADLLAEQPPSQDDGDEWADECVGAGELGVEQISAISGRRRPPRPDAWRVRRSHSRLTSADGVDVQGCGGMDHRLACPHAGLVPAVQRRLSPPRLRPRRGDVLHVTAHGEVLQRRAVRLPAAQRPDAITIVWPPHAILPPSLPPNGTGGRMAAVQEVKAKEPVREAKAEVLPPGRNCPASARQRHTGSDLGLCLRVERRTFSLHRRGPRIGRRKTRLTCGAPLRNRTVDLLLTIHNALGSLPGGGVAGLQPLTVGSAP